MKKILALILTLIVCVGMLSMTVHAASASISVSSASVQRGNEVSVSVSLGSNPGIIALETYINYNEDAMTLTDIDTSGLSGGVWTEPDPAMKKAIWDAQDPDSGTGEILTLTFSVKDTAKRGDYSVNVSALAFDIDFNEIEFGGKGTVTVTVPPCAVHKYGALSGSEPTCDEAGVKTQTCTECGHVNTVTTPKTGHSFGAWEKKDNNEHKRTCANGCGEIETAEHNWVEGVDTASCNQGGTRTDTCSVCQGTRVVETTATGNHNYVVSKSDDTNHWNECGCGAKDQTSVKGHVWVEGNDDSATCGGAGTRTDTCSVCDRTKTVNTKPTGKHEFKTYTTDGKDTHTATCTGCTATDTKGHEWNAGVVTTKPTCKDEGVKTFTCATCSGTKTEPVATTDHVYTKSYKDNGDGKTHTGICVCGKTNPEAENHELVLTNTVKPDCMNDGVNTYECSICKATVLEKLTSTGEHNFETWTTDGDTTHTSTCTGCKEMTKTEGHIWNEGVVTLESTCKVEGKKTYTCTAKGCGQTKTESLPLSTVHTFGDWTPVDENNHKHVCTVCETAEETKAHEWKLKEKQAATCVATGYEKYECVCTAEKTVELPINKDAHDLDYSENEDSNNHTVSCKNDGCTLEPFFEDHDYSIHGATSGRNQEMLCACGDKIIVKKSSSSADLDDVPKTNDITGQVVAVVACTMVAMMAAVAYTFKRKAVK